MNNQPMSADSKAQLIAGYVLNTLDEAEAQAFARMIAEDPTLIEDIDQTQQVLEHTYGISEALLPPQLRARVISAVEPDRNPPSIIKPVPSAQSSGSLPLIPIAPTQSQGGSSKVIWRWFQIGVASLIFVLGLSNYVLWRALRQHQAIAPATTSQAPVPSPPSKTPLSKTPSSKLTEPSNQAFVYTLQTTENSAGTAQVSIEQQTFVAQLTASQLPPLEPGQIYVLWTVVEPNAPFTTDSKNAILTTTFEVDNQGNASQQIVVPAAFQAPEQVAALGITIEAEATPQAHEGSPIMLLPL